MQIKNITSFLLKQYPLKQQEKWDESGYVVKGNLNKQTYKVFVCLDLNEKIVDEAIKQKAKLIVTHHPIFKSNPEHEMLPFYKLLLERLENTKTTVLALHTCFDNSRNGMNFLVGEKLRLKNLKWYKNQKFVMGNLPRPMSVGQIAQTFKDTFGVTLVTTNAKATDKYKKVAICAGAGLSVFAPMFDTLQTEKVLLVTGDIKHHGWQDLANYQLAALDVGHDLENCFCDFVASLIKQEFDNIECLSITTSKKEKVI